MILVDDEDLLTIFIYVFHQLLVIDLSETIVENTGSGELKQKKVLQDIKIKRKAKGYTFLGKDLLASIPISP